MKELSEEQKDILFGIDIPRLLVEHEYASTEEEAQEWLNDWQFEEKEGYIIGACCIDNAMLRSLLEDDLKFPGWFYHWAYTPEMAWKAFHEGRTDAIVDREINQRLEERRSGTNNNDLHD
jgi:hypothetical protein